MFPCYIKIASALAGLGISLFVIDWLSNRFVYLKKFRLVGQVAGLHCFPVAACGGMTNTSAMCTLQGIKMVGAHDQQFVIGKETDETFALSSPTKTMKQYFCPVMRNVKALCNGIELMLSTTDVETLVIPLESKVKRSGIMQLRRAENIVTAVDLGEDAAKWLTDLLQSPNLRLFQVLAEIACVTPGRSTFGNYVFAVQDSIDYINNMITLEPALNVPYFRPNIVVSGCSPLDESKWSYIKIGTVCFKVSGPDCRIISTNYIAERLPWKPVWELQPEVPNHVRVFSGSNYTAVVGINAKILREGEISLGDPVFVSY